MTISGLSNRIQAELSNPADKARELQLTMDNLLDSQDDQKLKEACQELEAVFVSQLIKAMRKTVPKNTWLDQGFGHEVFQSMLDDEYAKSIAHNDTLGLSRMLYDQLKFNLALAQQKNSAGAADGTDSAVAPPVTNSKK